MVYFDNAATTFPKPEAVRRGVDMAMVYFGANPGRSGHNMSVETARMVYNTRAAAAEFFGAAEVEQVAFTQNCTYAINTVVKGLLRPGDHVIISDLEHNSVLRPLHALSEQGMISYTVAVTCPCDDDGTVRAFEAAMRPETKLIFCTHASNVFGIRLPIARIAELAHSRGAFIAVDAAQTAGAEPIDVTKQGIDFLCTAGHKGLYGPTGTGLLITPHGERLCPLAEGGTGSLSMLYDQPDFMPDRLEAGTLNTVGIIGLGAGIEFVRGIGAARIAWREMAIAGMIYSGLSGCSGIKLYTPAPVYGESLPVISFNIEGMSSEEVTAKLNERGFALRGGLHCAPLAHEKFGTLESGTARISVGIFNTDAQARSLVAAIRQIVRL